MPFVKQDLRPFTKEIIEFLKIGQHGVYGLLRKDKNYYTWVYIGKGDIRARLLAHLNGDNPRITKQRPSHWLSELTNEDPAEREKQLIMEYGPICNK